MTHITYDKRSLLIDGKRQLLISGEMHYPRIAREDWARVLDLSKKAGINCIATYVFWNAHEPEPGVYDFSGNADLGEFLRLCGERDLSVILRLGPYICAETNYGGFPYWLRDVPGITTRTWNAPYIDRLERYFRQLIAHVKPHLATSGGPVILAQVENEYTNVGKRYGEDGVRYMDWIAGFAPSLGIDIPVITCYGGAKGAIECVNGFSVWQEVRKVFEERPGQPGIWTENWPAWYDIWGHQHHIRDPYEIQYEILRFLQNGGTGFNYYMWMGGTNFGRSTMYLQTTSYDFDGGLDEYGRLTEKGRTMADFHHALRRVEDALLHGDVTEPVEDGLLVRATWTLGSKRVHLVVNTSDDEAAAAQVAGTGLTLPEHRGAIVVEEGGSGEVVWRAWPQDPAYDPYYRPPIAFAPANITPLPPGEGPGAGLSWKSWAEPIGGARTESDQATRAAEEPIEQLTLTRDRSDYCWYVTRVSSPSARQADLHLTRAGDFIYVFVGGKPAASTTGPLVENRGPIVDTSLLQPINELEEDYYTGKRDHEYHHRFTIDLPAGESEIAILACAMGMIKGDWQICMPMNFERKGIWGDVLLDEEKLTGWRTIPFLLGELYGLDRPLLAGQPSAWSAGSVSKAPLTWYSADFSLPAGDLSDPDVDWAFDAAGLDKGLVWINGNLLGRYWSIPADGYGPDRRYHPPVLMGIGEGEPTQRYYHIKSSWLREKNAIVILSETGAAPGAHPIAMRRRPGGASLQPEKGV